MEFLKKIMKSKKSQDKKKVSNIKKNKKIKLEKKPLKKEIPKKEKPPIEIKPKGKRGRPKNPETKKILQPIAEQKPLTATQNAAAEIVITKVAKQESDKKIYKIKDHVIYPKHGVGQIVAIENSVIADIEMTYYKIQVTKDKLILTIPVNQQGNLRPISSVNQINKAISILKGKPKIRRTMWSRRAQEYDQKINSGEIYQIAEVVRDLNKNTEIPVDQSYSERQLFEKAYDRLLGEVAIGMQLSNEDAKKKLDKALGKKETVTAEPI
ncbi:COG1329 Transcriptional regulators, similar to M. xanthus CarD [Candidatus Pelagibacterales bacterium]|jgi:CarD family transcriptional regulator